MEFPALPADPLGGALHVLRMSGTYYSRSEFTAPWGLELPAMPGSLMFHVVTSGKCWIEVDGAVGRSLQPGDLALVPHGEGHRLASEPGVAGPSVFDLQNIQVSERYEILRQGGGGPPTTMICGTVSFDHPAARHLISVLPRLICVEATNSLQTDWISSTLRFMAAEASALRPGGEAVVTRLADVLVIQAIRLWIEQESGSQTGWLAALRDRQIGRAMTLIHRNPEQNWTVAGLANDVAMSRSAFAARFTELVGEPPMRYVARWRIQIALTILREDDASISELSLRLGYQSEAAFSRSFKRFIGHSPGAVRRKVGGDSARRESPSANQGSTFPQFPHYGRAASFNDYSQLPHAN